MAFLVSKVGNESIIETEGKYIVFRPCIGMFCFGSGVRAKERFCV